MDNGGARFAAASMAQLLALVQLAVQQTFTRSSAACIVVLTAAYLPCELPTGAGPSNRGTAGGALSRVALKVAAMHAGNAARSGRSPQPATHLPTAVRHTIPVPLWVGPLATEAHVATGHREHRALAGRAAPATLLHKGSGREGPLACALEMEDVETAPTAPDGFRASHPLTAHHALILSKE